MSTGMPTTTPNELASTMLAVLRATPGRRSISSIVSGTRPSNSATTMRAAPMMFLVLFRKKPVGWMISSTSAGSAAASDPASGYFAKRIGVTLFTPTSVVCAERMTATSSWNGLS